MALTLALAFLAGLVTVLSPCVLPVLPFLLGSSLQKNRLGPLLLVAGLFVSFTGFGLLITSVGFQIGFTPEKLRTVAALLLILAGFLMVSQRLQDGLVRLFSGVSAKAQTAVSHHSENGLKGQFFIGVLLGLVWTPCAGPTLGAAFGLAITRQGLLQALVVMVIYSLGAALPLLGIAYASQATLGHNKAVLRAMGSTGKWVLGGLLILFGMAVLLNWDKAAEAFLLNLVPDGWLDIITRF